MKILKKEDAFNAVFVVPSEPVNGISTISFIKSCEPKYLRMYMTERPAHSYQVKRYSDDEHECHVIIQPSSEQNLYGIQKVPGSVCFSIHCFSGLR